MSSGDAAPATPLRPEVVGRDEELTRLTDFADNAVERGARMVLLSGDAGIGKSTLTASFLDQLRESGWGTHIGHCIEYADRPLPFGPVVAVLRSLLLDDLERVDELVGHHREDLAGLVPELGDGDAGSASLAGDVDRLFDAIAALLTRASDTRPIAFLIEDVHWSDAATRDLLTSLVHNLRSARVLMLVTERTGALEKGNPLRTWLAEQRRFPNVHSIELEGLGQDDLAAQVASLTGEDADTSFVAELLERTGGNPYFAHELVIAHGQQSGELPSSLREFLTSRLSELGPDEREVLRAVAIAGGSVSHPVLAAMLANLNLGPVIRTLFDTGILQVDGQIYQFSHALLREAILDDVLPFEAEELHRAAAEALDANLGEKPAVNEVVALAVHWERAGDRPRSAAAASTAALAAAAVGAYETSADMGVLALASLDEAVDREARTELLLKTVDSLALSNRGHEAIELADDALATWIGDEPTSRARAQAAAAFIDFGIANFERADDRITKAVDLAKQTSSPEVGDVYLAASRIALRLGDIHSALASASTAIDVAGDDAPVRLLAEALGTRGLGIGVTDDLTQGLQLLRRSRGLAMDAGLPAEVARSYRNEMNVRLYREGRSAESVQALIDGLAYAEEHCGPILRATLKHDLALAHIESGDFRRAEPLIEELLDTPLEAQMRLWVLHSSALHSLGVGDLGKVGALLAEADKMLDRSFVSPEAAQQAALESQHARRSGRLEDAWARSQEALRNAERSDNITYWRDYLLELTRVLRDTKLTTGFVDPGRIEHAQQLRQEFDAPGTVNDALRSLMDFELAVTGGETDASAFAGLAIPLLNASEFHNEAVQAQLLEIQLRPPEALRRSSAEIEDLIARALERGVSWVVEDLHSLARTFRVPLSTTEAPTDGDESPSLPHFLTDREVEVMALLAEGMTNKAIGERLFVSHRTVSTHVSNLLAKLGVSTRGEAAAAFHRLGLDSYASQTAAAGPP